MNFLNNKLMVLDTEYDTNPKRLLSLAYIIYENTNKTKKVLYVKHDPTVFKVNEYGESFKYHKLTNKFLYENGKSLNDVINEFYNDLEGVKIIVGQNIMTADIHMIRKEAIGLGMWFDKIRLKMLSVSIYDTMKAFKNVHNGKSASLDNIYKFLIGKEMKDHHKALDDCKNTFKCFKIMSMDDKYTFSVQKLNFSEDIFLRLMSVDRQCLLCKNKMLLDDNGYILKSKFFSIQEKKYMIINSCYLDNLEEGEICKKCLNNIELMVQNNEEKLIDIVKLKVYDEFVNKFFTIKGTIKNKIYFKSKYSDKNEIKKLGGKWDGLKKSWYCSISEGDETTLQKFKKWLPKKSINI
jgi:hypothetical protein